MSMKIHTFINDVKNIRREDCEKYLSHFGMKTEIHPEVDFKEHTGFLPFKIEFPGEDFLEGGAFSSGFEFYAEDCEHEELFTGEEGYPANPDAERIIKGCRSLVTVRFGADDAFEGVLALAFSAYLAETCQGVIYDCEAGEYYYKNIKEEISLQIDDFFETVIIPELLPMHPFEGWN